MFFSFMFLQIASAWKLRIENIWKTKILKIHQTSLEHGRIKDYHKSTFRAFALRADKPFKQSIRLANLLKIEKKSLKVV